MSFWRDKADFMKDIERISEFYISGTHNNAYNKFAFKSTKENKPWFEESDSEEDTDNYSFGRGRITGNKTRDPGPETNHLDIMKEIQMQVRNAVGNRYNNEVLESYYNVCKDDEPDITPSQAPKEVSISYAIEQNRLKNNPKDPKKFNIAENIENAVTKLAEQRISSSTSSPVASMSSSPSSSPRKKQVKRRLGPRNYRNNQDYNLPFSTSKNHMNVHSNEEFPPL